MSSKTETLYYWVPYVMAGDSLVRHVAPGTSLPDALDQWADALEDQSAQLYQLTAQIAEHNHAHRDTPIDVDAIDNTLYFECEDPSVLESFADEGLIFRRSVRR